LRSIDASIAATLEVRFRGGRKEIKRANAARRGVLLDVANEGRTDALRSRGGAHDQRAQEAILTVDLKPDERARRAIGTGKKEVLEVRFRQVGGRQALRFEQRHDTQLRGSFSYHEDVRHGGLSGFRRAFHSLRSLGRRAAFRCTLSTAVIGQIANERGHGREVRRVDELATLAALRNEPATLQVLQMEGQR